MFGADNGRDELELNVPEELNLLVDGGNYGWPNCWGNGQGSNCEGTLPPIAEMEQRSSANGLVFYTGGMFPGGIHQRPVHSPVGLPPSGHRAEDSAGGT